MDISDIVSDEYVQFSPETPASKLAGVFTDRKVTGVVVVGETFEGVVTPKQLATSHRQPSATVGSLVWHVPRLDPEEDVRAVAQLMLDSDSQLLPVFSGDTLEGVVTAEGILRAVQPHLDAVSVRDAYTADLVTVDPTTTLGRALNVFRENDITHLPVVDDDTVAGILSLFDVTNFTVRSIEQSQGGDPEGTDSAGGDLSSGRSRGGGFGAREGESARMLDLPVRDVMVSPVRTTQPDATLADAVDEMFAIESSSVVVTSNGSPFGILTTTDVLDALTWEAGGNRAVQVYGTEYIEDLAYEDIVDRVEGFDQRDDGMNILDAKIHFHEHDEKHRGTPLLLARIRLHTDRGLYVASGEGYGAKHAFNEARNVLERQIRDRKTYGRSKKPPSEEFWEKRFGWYLEE
jgi:CBS domain-containing protein